MRLANGDDGPHLGERAELHALGLLERDDRIAVEAHVTRCSQCARALAIAEQTVALLVESSIPVTVPPARLQARIVSSAKALPSPPSHRIARSWGVAAPLAAIAATLLLAVGVGGGAVLERVGSGRQDARDGLALSAIATSHFDHLAFVARRAAAPRAKVLYARDGAWFYVIIDSAHCDCDIVVHSAAGERNLGAPQAHGDSAALFISRMLRPTSILLVDRSDHVLASAAIR